MSDNTLQMLGLALVVISSFVTLAGLVILALHLWWKAIFNIRNSAWVWEAIRHYRTIKPPPGSELAGRGEGDSHEP